MAQTDCIEIRVIKIIRRDLMLGEEIELTTNQPLFGGKLDLDSLDALLLIQSLEVEFGFKMPSNSFEPGIFKSVATLARFVEDRVAAR